jgi:hypothetical protein
VASERQIVIARRGRTRTARRAIPTMRLDKNGANPSVDSTAVTKALRKVDDTGTLTKSWAINW